MRWSSPTLKFLLQNISLECRGSDVVGRILQFVVKTLRFLWRLATNSVLKPLKPRGPATTFASSKIFFRD
jgi:hypothetical protein